MLPHSQLHWLHSPAVEGAAWAWARLGPETYPPYIDGLSENSDEGVACITSGRRSFGLKLLCAIPDAYEVSTFSTIPHALPPSETQLTTFTASSPSLRTLLYPSVQFPILRLRRAGSEGTGMGMLGAVRALVALLRSPLRPFITPPRFHPVELLSAIIPPKLPA